jgi:phosphoenolpyruvate carboxylase
MPKPTTHIIDWFHIAMKIQPMQQIADHIAQSQPARNEALSTIEDIRAVKWRLWHGRVDLRSATWSGLVQILASSSSSGP